MTGPVCTCYPEVKHALQSRESSKTVRDGYTSNSVCEKRGGCKVLNKLKVSYYMFGTAYISRRVLGLLLFV